jgi:hypothetical protein
MGKAGGLLFLVVVAAGFSALVAMLPELLPLADGSRRPARHQPPHTDAEAPVDANRVADAAESAISPVTVSVGPRTTEPLTPLPHRAAPQRGDRVSLARELQRELRRVGCYEGDLNGMWTPATRKAAKAFTDRINAALPAEEPDPILLRLVQDQQERACGAGCPAGEAPAADGRCVPAAILAARKPTPSSRTTPPSAQAPTVAVPGWSATRTTATPPTLPLESGQMALSGPQAPRGAADGIAPPAAPGEAGPTAFIAAPAVTVPTPRRAESKGTAPQASFGPAAFRVFEKNGF